MCSIMCDEVRNPSEREDTRNNQGPLQDLNGYKLLSMLFWHKAPHRIFLQEKLLSSTAIYQMTGTKQEENQRNYVLGLMCVP
jgi:hypothetical protein